MVGLDITREMLEQARGQAAKRSLGNIDWVLADAEHLPFEDSAFDVYTVRAAPHHFLHLDRALSEAARVLKPGGRAAFIDCSPPAVAREKLHEVEVGRDASHVRSYTLAEWEARVEEAGLVVEAADRVRVDLRRGGLPELVLAVREEHHRPAGERLAALEGDLPLDRDVGELRGTARQRTQHRQPAGGQGKMTDEVP